MRTVLWRALPLKVCTVAWRAQYRGQNMLPSDLLSGGVTKVNVARAQETVWIWSKGARFKGWGWRKGGGGERERGGAVLGGKHYKSWADSQSGAADTLSLSFTVDVPSVKNREDFCSEDKLSGRCLCVFPLLKCGHPLKKHVEIRRPHFPFFLSHPRQGDLHYRGSRLYLCKQDCYSSLSRPCPPIIPGQLELFLSYPTPCFHSRKAAPPPPRLLSISLAFIFSLIELNKKIMFDINSLWTCGPADRRVCLLLRGKWLFCPSFVRSVLCKPTVCFQVPPPSRRSRFHLKMTVPLWFLFRPVKTFGIKRLARTQNGSFDRVGGKTVTWWERYSTARKCQHCRRTVWLRRPGWATVLLYYPNKSVYLEIKK